ncbi:metallophosphoesterase family protein [Mucilaginibacter sp. KACC 22063]|uniref:metallophosphoesterase family protein n=1 Tax=Mucilaginibacter sp. KACC 22063 TaxID=3025666 RepID=UPI00236729AE|nr:metallophosphoesterase [Mucilaginibacter sp. KACC 22063]WDF55572.1 metallophosphoesterase [Mucilaginibacter sp. KACC 22063]
MSNRRKFIKSGIAGIAGISLLPAVNSFASPSGIYKAEGNFKLRFAIASDGHYAQPDTDSDKFYSDLIGWLNNEHQHNHLDLVIINGDLVHNRPDLLPKVKETYLDKLPVPYHTLPGNHDFADAAIWKKVFGYEDNYSFDFGDIGFVLANTATTKGEYVCPNNAFLKFALDQYAQKRIVFVILHIPPHQWMEEEKTIFVDCPGTVELLHKYPNVKAAFHGHDHSLDSVRYTGKLPHFFDSHFGGNWGTAYKGYRIVEVGNDYAITTYQVNASMNPQLNLNKF